MNQKYKITMSVIVAILLLSAGVVYYDFAQHKESPVVPITQVRLFYYNQEVDKELSGSGNALCSPDAVLPVAREMHVTATPIQDTIELLIRGELTPAEKVAGFATEFPHDDFRLLGAELNNGLLTLEFTEVPGFTSGGSCRISLLAEQIIKTARQFPEVREVKFKPEELFQP